MMFQLITVASSIITFLLTVCLLHYGRMVHIWAIIFFNLRTRRITKKPLCSSYPVKAVYTKSIICFKRMIFPYIRSYVMSRLRANGPKDSRLWIEESQVFGQNQILKMHDVDDLSIFALF